MSNPEAKQAIEIIRALVRPGLTYWQIEDFVKALQLASEKSISSPLHIDRAIWLRVEHAITCIAAVHFGLENWLYAVSEPTKALVKVLREGESHG